MKITLHCYIINYYLTQWTDNRMPDKRGTDNRGSTVFITFLLYVAEFLTSSPYKTVGESRSLRRPSPVSLLLAGEDSVHASPSEILDSKLNQFSPVK